jgi:hypothetical protein
MDSIDDVKDLTSEPVAGLVTFRNDRGQHCRRPKLGTHTLFRDIGRRHRLEKGVCPHFRMAVAYLSRFLSFSKKSPERRCRRCPAHCVSARVERFTWLSSSRISASTRSSSPASSQ